MTQPRPPEQPAACAGKERMTASAAIIRTSSTSRRNAKGGPCNTASRSVAMDRLTIEPSAALAFDGREGFAA